MIKIRYGGLIFIIHLSILLQRLQLRLQQQLLLLVIVQSSLYLLIEKILFI